MRDIGVLIFGQPQGLILVQLGPRRFPPQVRRHVLGDTMAWTSGAERRKLPTNLVAKISQCHALRDLVQQCEDRIGRWRFLSGYSLPLDLAKRCLLYVMLLEKEHGVEIDKIIMINQDIQALAARLDELKSLLDQGTKAWRRSKRIETFRTLSVYLLTLDIISANFRGWGDRLPVQCAQARRVFDGLYMQKAHPLMLAFGLPQNRPMRVADSVVNFLFDPDRQLSELKQ